MVAAAGAAFDRRYEELSTSADLIAYNGHAGLGQNVRALAQNLRHGRLVSGASTITQQLVKLLDNEGQPRPRTFSEKLKEAARAENLEKVVSKQAILEAYLNRLSYGHGLTGPESAAHAYFGKSARDLSWAEAAYLATSSITTGSDGQPEVVKLLTCASGVHVPLSQVVYCSWLSCGSPILV